MVCRAHIRILTQQGLLPTFHFHSHYLYSHNPCFLTFKIFIPILAGYEVAFNADIPCFAFHFYSSHCRAQFLFSLSSCFYFHPIYLGHISLNPIAGIMLVITVNNRLRYGYSRDLTSQHDRSNDSLGWELHWNQDLR